MESEGIRVEPATDLRPRLAEEQAERVGLLQGAVTAYRAAMDALDDAVRTYLDSPAPPRSGGKATAELMLVGDALYGLKDVEASLLRAYAEYLVAAPRTRHRSDVLIAANAAGRERQELINRALRLLDCTHPSGCYWDDRLREVVCGNCGRIVWDSMRT